MNKKNVLIELIKQYLYKRNYESFTNWLLDGTDFLTAPASTLFHNNFKGGLLEHSFKVYKLLKEKNKRYKMNLKDDSVFLTGMFHDISKTNTYKWNEEYKIYEKINHPILKHGELSVQILQNKLGRLRENEIAMIRYHMGGFDEQYPYTEINNAIQKYPEIVLICCADWEASRILERKKI
jgi:putative nucleotidyltransferase with HDIG domain